MSSLRSRYSLQGLERLGVFLADQPGLVIKGKPLNFYALKAKVPEGPVNLAALRGVVQAAVAKARRDVGLESLHLYYLDTEGNLIVSVSGQPQVPPVLELNKQILPLHALLNLGLERRYEATGRTGVLQRRTEDTRDVYTALERFQTSYQLGWGGLFFARDAEKRSELFRFFDPVRSGVFRVEETLTRLVCVHQLIEAQPGGGLVPYLAVRTTLEQATLAEALAWS